jgi:hypothetical protein
VQIKRVESNYYDVALSERSSVLSAPSTFHLTKTIVMENMAFNEEALSDPFYPRYICVAVQYESRLNAENVMRFMRAW